jgi:hypothetical protein
MKKTYSQRDIILFNNEEYILLALVLRISNRNYFFLLIPKKNIKKPNASNSIIEGNVKNCTKANERSIDENFSKKALNDWIEKKQPDRTLGMHFIDKYSISY